MRIQLTKITLAATFGLAMAFTLSCSDVSNILSGDSSSSDTEISSSGQTPASSSSGLDTYGTPCGSYCKWSTGCYEIATDPEGRYSENAFKTCSEAIESCDYYGLGRYNNDACAGSNISTVQSCGNYCKWATGCYEIKTDPAGMYGDAVTTCATAISNCDNYGFGKYATEASCLNSISSSSLSSSSSAASDTPCGGYCKWSNECSAIYIDPDNNIETCEKANVNCDYNGSGRYNNATCTGNNLSTVKRESCGGYCDWGSGGCWEISTDPAGLYGDVVATCATAISNCASYGLGRFSDSECHTPYTSYSSSSVSSSSSDNTVTSTPTPCGEYCKWNDSGECTEITTDPDGKYNNGESVKTCADAKVRCNYWGNRYSNSTCTGSTLTTNAQKPESCGGYCKWDTGCYELVTDPAGMYGNSTTSCARMISDCNSRFSDSACLTPYF